MRRSAPPSTRCVAKEWRRRCGCRSSRLSVLVSSRRPRAERKSAFSAPRASCRPGLAQVAGDGERGELAERHDALLRALAAHPHELLVEVDVAEVETDRLGAPEAGGVDELEDRPVAERERAVAGESLDEVLDLLLLRRLRQPLGQAWRQRRVRHAGRPEGEAQERADGRDPARDRRRREPRPAPVEPGHVVGEDADVDLVDRRVSRVQPVGEMAEVGRVGPARRLGEPRRREKSVDGGCCLHRPEKVP